MNLTEKEHAKIMDVLWADRTGCMARSTCGLMVALGYEVTPTIAQKICEARHDIFNDIRPRYLDNKSPEREVFCRLIEYANQTFGTSIPKPSNVTDFSFLNDPSQRKAVEVVIFIDPFPNHPTHHVFHLGSQQIELDGVTKIQDAFEAFDLSLLQQSFQHHAASVYIFPKSVHIYNAEGI